MSSGPVTKLKVTGVAAARSRRTIGTQRENRAAIIVSYGDHAGVYLFAVAPLFMMKMHQRTLCIYPAPADVYYVYRWRVDISSKSPKTWLRGRPPLPLPPPTLATHKSTAFKSVTEKIRSDVPHLSQCRSILSVLDWGIENFSTPSSRDLLLALKMIEICFKQD